MLLYAFRCVADPGSGAFWTPGSGIRNSFLTDPGAETHVFELQNFFSFVVSVSDPGWVKIRIRDSG
jgi:hypothetical protein